MVVALDRDGLAASIKASTDRLLIVEIGPVSHAVVNEVLGAAAESPLVDQVRVRGVTMGRRGTLISLHIVGKSPLAGSVRRGTGRVYIDLESLA